VDEVCREEERKEGKMKNLQTAMLKCLAGAQRVFNETEISGVCAMLIGTDRVVRYAAAAENYEELLENMLLCAWDTLHKMNAAATPDGFAQAAYATAVRAGTDPQVAAIRMDLI
jgi:hypothetical protein